MRNMLFGFGAGLVLLSLVLLVAYGRDTLPPSNAEDEPLGTVMLTDDEIAERAAELGMIWPDADTLSDVAIIRRAFELGMVFETDVTMTPTPTEASDPAPTVDMEPTVSSTPTADSTVTPTPLAPTVTSAPVATSMPTPTNGSAVETQRTDAEGEPITLVTLTVRAGSNALNVARQLYDAGLIEDVNAYVQYLANQNKTRTIRAGQYTIQKGASFEAITAILTRTP